METPLQSSCAYRRQCKKCKAKHTATRDGVSPGRDRDNSELPAASGPKRLIHSTTTPGAIGLPNVPAVIYKQIFKRV